jgi:hypothetical protein
LVAFVDSGGCFMVIAYVTRKLSVSLCVFMDSMNNTVLRIFSVLGLITVLSGFIMV